jgi:hypothetical protein
MTTYNPHKKHTNATQCTAWTLITVAEGVQCSNCLALVVDHRETKNMHMPVWAETRVLQIVEDAKFYVKEGIPAEQSFLMASQSSTLSKKYLDMALEKVRSL